MDLPVGPPQAVDSPRVLEPTQTMYTRCPHCATVYRVTPQQLQASSGQVKCGRCQAQFDAFASLAASLPAGHDARPGDAARMPAASPSPIAASEPIGAPEQAPSIAPHSSSVPVSGTPAPASAPSDVHVAAEDQVAAYVHRYGSARAQHDADAQEADGAHGETLGAEDEEGAADEAPSSIDRFADSLRVLQAVARLSLDVDDSRPRPHADQPWVEAVTDAPQAQAIPEMQEPASTHEEAARDAEWDWDDERAAGRSSDAGTYEAATDDFGTSDLETPDSDTSAHDTFAPTTPEDGAHDGRVTRGRHADETVVIELAAPPAPVPEPPRPALTVPDALLEGGAVPLRHRGRWLAAVAGLALALAVQALWWFASPVANALPGTRAPLELACGLLGCEVALPQLPEQLSIEGSDLQLLDVARPQEVLLTAQIRNRATVAQQLPAIELTLIDTANRVVGRRVLRPADYVEAGRRVQDGIAGNEEVPVRLYLNTGDLRAAGYRLYLFFG